MSQHSEFDVIDRLVGSKIIGIAGSESGNITLICSIDGKEVTEFVFSAEKSEENDGYDVFFQEIEQEIPTKQEKEGL